MSKLTFVSSYVLLVLVACCWYLQMAKSLSESGGDVRWAVCVQVIEADWSWFNDGLLVSGQVYAEAGRVVVWLADLGHAPSWAVRLVGSLGHSSGSTWARLVQVKMHEQGKTQSLAHWCEEHDERAVHAASAGRLHCLAPFWARSTWVHAGLGRRWFTGRRAHRI